jgi:hypothetical protein
VGGQRNPLSDHKDKIVDFCHLEQIPSILRIACVPEIVAGLAGGKASSERADPAVETGDGALSDPTQPGLEFAELASRWGSDPVSIGADSEVWRRALRSPRVRQELCESEGCR